MCEEKPVNEVIAVFAQRGAKLGNCGRMCSECAFRLGSAANLEEHNAEAALQASLLPGYKFHCHPQGKYGDAGRECVGFQYAKLYLDKYFDPATL
jgi:hypothetical protein